MVRLGKWAENKINFRDNTRGYRGLQWSPGRTDTFYRLCWFGRVRIPARGTATNYGGTARFQRTRGGQGEANVWARTTGTYATAAWGHGIQNVVGAFCLDERMNAASTVPTALCCTVINATTVRVQVEGFTAYTLSAILFVWGATAFPY